MSLDAITIGRHTNRRKQEIKRQTESKSVVLDSRKGTRKVSPDDSQCDDLEESNSQTTINNDPSPSTSTGPSPSNLSSRMKSPENNVVQGHTSSVNSFQTSYEPTHPEVNMSPQYYVEKTMEAAAKLSEISNVRVTLDLSMTKLEAATARASGFDAYVRCVTEYMMVLPGWHQYTGLFILFLIIFFLKRNSLIHNGRSNRPVYSGIFPSCRGSVVT